MSDRWTSIVYDSDDEVADSEAGGSPPSSMVAYGSRDDPIVVDSDSEEQVDGFFNIFSTIGIYIAGIIGSFLSPLDVHTMTFVHSSMHGLFHVARRVHFMHFSEGDAIGTPLVPGISFYFIG